MTADKHREASVDSRARLGEEASRNSNLVYSVMLQMIHVLSGAEQGADVANTSMGNVRRPKATPKKRSSPVETDRRAKRKNTQGEQSQCSVNNNETQKENKDNNKPYDCKLCENSFKTEAARNSHYFGKHNITDGNLVFLPDGSALVDSSLQPYVTSNPEWFEAKTIEYKADEECKLCKVVLFDKDDLLTHYEKVHKVKMTKVDVDAIVRLRPTDSQEMPATHNCKICTKIFDSPGGLQKHRLTAHANEAGTSKDYNTSAEKQVYNEEEAATTSAGVADEASTAAPHLREEHTNKETSHYIYKCKECGLHFDRLHFLFKHLGNCSPDSVKITCECKLAFDRQNLDYHFKIHASGVTTFDVKQVDISDVEKIDVSGMTERYKKDEIRMRNEETRLSHEHDSDDAEDEVGASRIDAREMAEQANQEMSLLSSEDNASMQPQEGYGVIEEVFTLPKSESFHETEDGEIVHWID